MDNFIENRHLVILPNLVLANTTVPFSLVVNKTPNWGDMNTIDVAKLLKIYTINFLMELEVGNYPEGQINIYHSYNYFLLNLSYKQSENLPRYMPQPPQDIPSCEYTGFPHSHETLKKRNIFLNCKAQLWNQFAYQFFHEYCHYMTRTITSNWFLEALCELSSLYFLRKLSITWLMMSLTDNIHCKMYKRHFFEYAQNIINRSTEPEASLADWYESNKTNLQKNKIDRSLNGTVAKYFLPYFEANPGIWNIVCFVPFENISDFPLFMSRWHENCPDNYKKHIQKFITDLGI